MTLLKAAGCSIVQGFLFGVPKRDAEPACRRGIRAKMPQRSGAGAAERLIRSNCPGRDHRRLRTEPYRSGEETSNFGGAGDAVRGTALSQMVKRPLATAVTWSWSRRRSRRRLRARPICARPHDGGRGACTARAVVADARQRRRHRDERSPAARPEALAGTLAIANIDRVLLVSAEGETDSPSTGRTTSAELEACGRRARRRRAAPPCRRRAAPIRSTRVELAPARAIP